MLLKALTAARDLGRLHEIASVLVRHGLGDLVRRLGVAGALERAGRALHWETPARLLGKSAEQHAREALEELGPTFVKLGQILAGRPDLLPPEWTEELARLHEHVTSVPFDELREQVTEDLGAPPEQVFDELSTTPLAAASIAQVYAAKLKDGREVVLKVRRPGIRETVEADLRLLARLAEVVESEMPELRRFRPRHLVHGFRSSLRRELDLAAEARAARRIRKNLGTDAALVIPAIHDEWTTERLCVMERLPGTSLAERLRAGDLDPAEGRRVAAAGAQAVLRMVFVDGFFHADPHPGNVLLLPDGRLGLLDFGMVGSLGEERRAELLELLMGIAGRRTDDVVEVLLGWAHDGDVDLGALSLDCAAFVDRYEGAALGEIDTSALLIDVATIVRHNDLVLPDDVALLIKTFLTLDGLGRRLDPGFVMSAEIEPFARRALQTWRSPFAVLRRGRRELQRLLLGLPRDARRLLLAARRGRLKVDVDVASLDRLGQHLDKSANRLTVGLITAALIVGTSIVLTVTDGEGALFGPRMLGLLGFLGSLVAGFWLLWSILRSGRR